MDLAERIGTDGRRLLELVYAESSLPWLGELEAIQTLRQVWIQHYHADEQNTPWRPDGELPPSALLVTSPGCLWKHAPAARKALPGPVTSIHFTETCEADAPHLIVVATPTAATTADGDIVGELHES